MWKRLYYMWDSLRIGDVIKFQSSGHVYDVISIDRHYLRLERVDTGRQIVGTPADWSIYFITIISRTLNCVLEEVCTTGTTSDANLKFLIDEILKC